VNHPAWVIGHLTFVCEMLGAAIGLSPWLPADWAERFGPGSVPKSDASLYESRDQALERLSEAQSRITRAVEQLDESRLNEAFPDEQYLDVFPTLRHFFTQVLVGHAGFHIGQVSVWRRAIRLPPMRRSFE